MTKQTKADSMLLMITVFWGASYIFTKIGLETLQPFNLTALRFIIAFLVAGAVFYKNILKADKTVLGYSFILAVILFGVFITMTIGLKYTTASNAGFLVSLSVVIIPLISYLFLKQKLNSKTIICIFFAVLGIALLTLNNELRVGWGDILCILCALLFAVHIVLTGIFTKDVDSIALGVIQLGFVGLLNTIFSAFTETVKLPNTFKPWVVILLLSIFCTTIGYIVQATAQKYTSPTHTGLILSLEPVFSAVFAYFVLDEQLALRGYIGAAILLASVLIAELDIKTLYYDLLQRRYQKDYEQ